MKKGIFTLGCILLLLSACREKRSMWSVQGTALGTFYEILYVGEEDRDMPRQVDSMLRHYNRLFSIFDTASWISRLNRNETDSLPEALENVLQRSLELCLLTEGRFDITAAPLINAWGFGPEATAPPDSARIDSLKQFVGYSLIRIQNHRLHKEDPRIQLNLNAIAKGYIVDCLAACVREKHPDFLVNIGGEISAGGKRPDGKDWVIGIQMPTRDSVEAGEQRHSFRLQAKQRVATSGDYRRYHTDSTGRRYAHIINPKTGYSETSDILSATVIAEDCMTADALATAFMVMGKEASLALLQQHPEWSACLIAGGNGEWILHFTPDFPPSNHLTDKQSSK